MIITINNENKVISQARGKIFDNIGVNNETTFRVDDVPTVAETEELYFNPDTLTFYTEPKPSIERPTPERLKAIREAKQSKEDALKWLADNDWKVNKRVLGEWTEDDERWLAYLADRATRRKQIDNADAILNS